MFNISKKNQFYFLALLLLVTIILTTRYFNYGMMGLTTFVLAYLSKGMRRYSAKKLPQNRANLPKIQQEIPINH